VAGGALPLGNPQLGRSRRENGLHDICADRTTVIAVFPDREVDLGVVAEDEWILIREVAGPGTWRRDAVKLKAGDPRIV
jgi:hypothetical protein